MAFLWSPDHNRQAPAAGNHAPGAIGSGRVGFARGGPRLSRLAFPVRRIGFCWRGLDDGGRDWLVRDGDAIAAPSLESSGAVGLNL